MKIPSRVDGSVCGAVLSNRPAARLRKATAGAESAAIAGARSLCAARDVSVASKKSRLGSSFFCSRSSLWLLSTFTPTVEACRPVRIPRARDAVHTYSTAAAAVRTHPDHISAVRSAQDQQLLLSFVNREDEGTVDEHFEYHRDPYRRGYAPSDGPKLQVSERKTDIEYPSREDTAFVGEDDEALLRRLYVAIAHRIRHPNRTSLDAIYKLYCQLPEPKMLNIPWQWRNRLLKVMGTPRRRDTDAMLRYFALVADVKNAGLSLRRTQWNFALAFAAKYASRATPKEMESALRLWREMEREAKIPGNDVTFNILFDVAAKAGNFTLAEMIYQEMDHRGIEFNRFHHVSLIHYFGLKLDSGGIRAAYKEMVESGEMVDTTVLNCVLSGLLRCGEESAAEETYERMKNGHDLAVDMPPRDYMMSKVTTQVLMMFTKVGKEHPKMKPSLQTGIRLVPDLHTYKLLVEHYALKVGNIKKVAQYLDEMKQLKIPIHPTIFLALFKGFYAHGGFEGSEWSDQRLEGVLSALYSASDMHAKGFRIDRWLVIWALRALKKCATDEKVVKGFDKLAERWDIPAEREPFMHDLLTNVIEGSDMKSPEGNWVGMSHRRRKKDGSRM